MSVLGQLLPNGKFTAVDSNGNLLVGGKLYSYAATTTTPKATYTDASLATPNANPVVLDSSGAASVWIDNSGYKFILKDSVGNTLWSNDQVYLVSPGSIGTAQIADGAVTPDQMDLSTLTSGDLPSGVIGADQIQNGIITGGPGGKIAPGTIEFSNLDPALDFTQLSNMIEVLFSQPAANGNGNIKCIPQYPWSAPVQMNNPGTTPTGNAGQAKWSPDNNFLAVAHTTTPFVTVYQRKGSVLTKLPDPATLPTGNANAISWSPDGEFLAVAHTTTPFLTIYRRRGVNFTKITGPNILPAGDAFGVSWSPDGRFLSVTHKVSPGLTVYQVQKQNLENFPSPAGNQSIYKFTVSSATAGAGDTYGPGGGSFYTVLFSFNGTTMIAAANSITPGATGSASQLSGSGSASVSWSAVEKVAFDADIVSFSKIADPSTLPSLSGGTAMTPKWSPDGTLLVIGAPVTPFVLVYQLSGTTLSYLTAPASLPPGSVISAAWSPDQSILAVGSSVSGNFITFYQVGAGPTFTVFTVTASLPINSVVGLAFSPNGKFLAAAWQQTPFISVYSISGITLTLLPNVVTLPLSNPNDISWSPTSEYLAVAITSTPYFNWYQTANSSFPSNALLWVRNLIHV